MKFQNIILLLAFAAVSVFLTNCKKDDDNGVDPNEKGHIEIEFDQIVGDKNLQLGTGSYQNATGETYSVTLLNYYVSNFVFKKADGSTYTVPQEESYFLIKESDAATHSIEIEDVPAGDYTEMSFILGVDSLRSTMEISQRTGVLDPAAGKDDDNMYWTWNSGYIFFKMEGLSPQVPVDPAGNQKYRFHIGGFGGYSGKTINNIKTITLSFNGDKAKVRANDHPHIHTYVDISKVFDGSSTVKLAENSTVMFSPYSVYIANNYTNMFRVDHIHQ